MGWRDFFRRQAATPEILDIPLFPLNTVLFPGETLDLKVFEPRYLDMASAALKDGSPFGICLIAQGQEVGHPAEPHPVGTLAKIERWDMPQLGILMLTVRGGQRFNVLESSAQADGLLRARVTPLAEAPSRAIPPAQATLVPLLRQIIADRGDAHCPPPHHFDDAAWVGYRLAEVMPVQPLAKQKLLELEDPVSRLEILQKYLAQRGLVG